MGRLCDHLNYEVTRGNCIEGNAVGYKTPEKNGVYNHIDNLNYWRDHSYVYTAVIIFYNRLGCETSCELDANVEEWLNDVKNYIAKLPTKLTTVSSEILKITDNNPNITAIIQQKMKAKQVLKWWTEAHAIELLYFSGLTCTPVTP
eukprot:13599299-Ditylum_brightwellii.AAC.1